MNRPLNLRDFEIISAQAGRLTQLRRPVALEAQRATDSDIHGYGGACDFVFGEDAPPIFLYSPFGSPGHHLWARETHFKNWQGVISYRADGGVEPSRWRPPQMMPRKLSRFDLVVESVRVERLQAITRWDIRACGLGLPPSPEWIREDVPSELHNVFAREWDSLYKKKGFGWSANPWVWVADVQITGKKNA